MVQKTATFVWVSLAWNLYDSILDELDEVVDDYANIEEVNAVNNDANIVSA